MICNRSGWFQPSKKDLRLLRRYFAYWLSQYMNQCWCLSEVSGSLAKVFWSPYLERFALAIEICFQIEPLLDLNQVKFYISFLVAHKQQYQDIVPTSAETRVQWIFSLVGWWFGSVVLAFSVSPKYLHSTFPSLTISLNTSHIYFTLLTPHFYFTALISVSSQFWGPIFVSS